MNAHEQASTGITELELVPLGDVPAMLPRRGGRRVHASTVYRWALNGLHGIRLRTVRIGRTQATTRAWLMDFFGAIAEARDGLEPPQMIPTRTSPTATPKVRAPRGARSAPR